MKIKKLRIQKYKLLELKLIKTKTYKYKDNNFNKINIKEIEYKIKKILNIVYQYHINNKKILFICDNSNYNAEIKNKIIKNNHNLMPESVWKNGITSNIANKNSNMFNIILNLKKKNDLIIYISKNSNENLLNEIENSKIPIISFLNINKMNERNSKSLYKIKGNFIITNTSLKNNLLFELILMIFKKANKVNNKKHVIFKH